MYLQRLEKQGLVEGNSGFVGEKELGEKFKGEWHNKLQHQASELKGYGPQTILYDEKREGY